jgi:protein tyrosine phosphatase type 4A
MPTTIAVHCVAGLGRAPALVAIALIELLDMQPLDAVEFIRRKRRGSFNKPQIAYLDAYKPTLRKNATKLSLSRIFFGRFSSNKKDKQPPNQSQADSIPLSSCV